tara:strand:- start:122 stop:1252 length:1131 start_codon:yes stop_codon:yes gene_type:complete
MAVAWAHSGPVALKLIEHKEKFSSIIVGLDFCATDPDFIDALCDTPNAFVFKKSGACFHPKIYLFRTGRNVEAIVGSANFTKGGLSSNFEVCLHLRCDVGDLAITELFAVFDSYTDHAQPVTKLLANAYRRQADIAASVPRPRSPVLPSESKKFEMINSDLLKMSWSRFLEKVRREPNNQFDTRMKLLRYLQTLFSREKSFNGLTVSEWKAVAGIVHNDATGSSGLKQSQIGWFGSMQGSGSFTNLILNKDKGIADAVDCIPRRGEVNESDYLRFCDLFVSAFSSSARTGGCSTATRLLAMKRPDLFVCVNNGNKPSLAQALQFSPTTLNLENYWERIIEPIRLSSWYNAVRPISADSEAWDCRVALVDAIHYREV